jgi:uncharacterized protein
LLSDDRKLTVAAAFTAASGTNDGAAIAAMCAPGAVTWHNHDGLETPAVDTGKGLAWVHRAVPDVVWQTVALKTTSDGFVWQSVLTGTAPGGPLQCASCVVVSLDEDGRIRRIEEYLDPAQTRVMRG